MKSLKKKINGDLKTINESKDKLSSNEINEIENSAAYKNMTKLMEVKMNEIERQNTLNPVENRLDQDIRNFNKNNLKKVETNDRSAPILPKPGNVNLESESMIRRAFGMGSKNVGDLKELLNTFTNNILLSENSFKNLKEITDSNAKNLSTEQLSGAISEIQDALNNKNTMIEKKTAQLAKNIVSQMELLKGRREIKELEVAKSKMNTWNKLFDKKTYNEAKETLNSKDNLNKLNDYAQKVSNDPNMSEQVKDKLMGKIGDLVKDIEKNIDSKINKDQKEIYKQSQKITKYEKEVKELKDKSDKTADEKPNLLLDIEKLENTAGNVSNLKIKNKLNKLAQEKTAEHHSSSKKDKKSNSELAFKKYYKIEKHSIANKKRDALEKKVTDRREIKDAVEGVGKHVEKYKTHKENKNVGTISF